MDRKYYTTYFPKINFTIKPIIIQERKRRTFLPNIPEIRANLPVAVYLYSEGTKFFEFFLANILVKSKPFSKTV